MKRRNFILTAGTAMATTSVLRGFSSLATTQNSFAGHKIPDSNKKKIIQFIYQSF